MRTETVSNINASLEEFGAKLRARSALWIRDSHGAHSLQIAKGHPTGAIDPTGLTVAPKCGLVGLAARVAKPIAITDATKEPIALDTGTLTGFTPRGVFSTPIRLNEETWGVLQFTSEESRRWNAQDSRDANRCAQEVAFRLAEQFVPQHRDIGSIRVGPEPAPLSTRITPQQQSGFVVVFDLISSTKILEHRSGKNLLMELHPYFTIIASEAERFNGSVFGNAGDSLTILFKDVNGETTAPLIIREFLNSVSEGIAGMRRNLGYASPDSAPFNFHCAVTHGNFETSLLLTKDGPIHCALGPAIHAAYRLTKTPIATEASTFDSSTFNKAPWWGIM